MLSDMDSPANAERRAFYLSLDPESGQSIAQAGGFVPPSIPVMLREQEEVMKGWMKLSALGLVDAVDEYVDWYLDVLGASMGHELPDGLRAIYASSIRHLMVSSLLGLSRKGLITVRGEDEVEFETAVYDPVKGEVVPPDFELAKAIEELEHVFKSMDITKEEDDEQ